MFKMLVLVIIITDWYSAGYMYCTNPFVEKQNLNKIFKSVFQNIYVLLKYFICVQKMTKNDAWQSDVY